MTFDPQDDAVPRALEGLLSWYVAMGVDAAIDDIGHDRFEESALAPSSLAPASNLVSPKATERREAMTTQPALAARIAPARPVAAASSSTSATTTSAEELIRQAEALAAAADTLDALEASLQTLPGCGLAATASQMIFAGGTVGAPIMLIGGAPDSDDERQGQAFAGAHGRLLDAMLRAIGLDRGGVYLGNVIPWRPPGNRAPTPLELALCLPFTRRQIALAAPKLIVCLGEKAAQPLLDTKEPISRLRGRWMRYEGDTTTVKALVTFSPDYLLKQPLQKRRAWTDLHMLASEHASPTS